MIRLYLVISGNVHADNGHASLYENKEHMAVVMYWKHAMKSHVRPSHNTGPLCGESTSHVGLPCTVGSVEQECVLTCGLQLFITVTS